MYVEILLKFLIILIVLNYSYAKLFKTDLLDYILVNDFIIKIFNTFVILIAIYYLFNRDFYLPFLGPSVIPITKVPLQGEKLVEVNLTKLPPDVNVLYWASGESDKDYSDPLDAYKNYSNAGMAKTDNSGNILIKIACPGRYYINKFGLKKQKLPRHMHYRYEFPNYSGLYSRVYTKYIEKC